MSNSLDPNQAIHFVGPVLGPNDLQRLSADDISARRVKVAVVFRKCELPLESLLKYFQNSIYTYI